MGSAQIRRRRRPPAPPTTGSGPPVAGSTVFKCEAAVGRRRSGQQRRPRPLQLRRIIPYSCRRLQPISLPRRQGTRAAIPIGIVIPGSTYTMDPRGRPSGVSCDGSSDPHGRPPFKWGALTAIRSGGTSHTPGVLDSGVARLLSDGPQETHAGPPWRQRQRRPWAPFSFLKVSLWSSLRFERSVAGCRPIAFFGQRGRRRLWTSWGGSGISVALAATTKVYLAAATATPAGAVFLLEGVTVECSEV